MKTVTSRDGTAIAYEILGHGPLVVSSGGAFNDRSAKASGLPLAKALAQRFTVVVYDRRGRGDSGDTPPYTVAKEVEDIGALIAANGGSAMLYGMSSGGALALEATTQLAVNAVAVYEPPFCIGAEAQQAVKAYDARLHELVAAGDDDDAAAHFLKHVGMPSPAIEGVRKAPHWLWMVRMAPTLLRESAVLRCENGAPIPDTLLRSIDVPLLALAGGSSRDALRAPAKAVAQTAPRGSFQVLPGQTHDVAVEALAPALIAFFERVRL